MFANFGDGYANFKNSAIRKTVSNYNILPTRVLFQYLNAFKKASESELPLINPENSPLHNGALQNYFSGYDTNYRNKFGSRRLFGNYAINFESNGGTPVDKQFVEEGNLVALPENPVKVNDDFVE